MRKVVMGVVVSAILAGCSTTPADLQSKTSAEVRDYALNYQEVYRRVSSSAKRCSSGNINAYASYEVDAELYNELGYGEVSLSMVNLGTRNYYWTAKIEKAGSGTKITVNSGNTLNAATLKRNIFVWADGGQGC